MEENINKNKKKRNKTLIFLYGSIGVVTIIAFIIIALGMNNWLSGQTSSSSNDPDAQYIAEADEIHQYLVDLSNEEIDKSLEKKEAIYDVDKIISINIDTNELTYSSYNEKYLFTLSMEIDNQKTLLANLKDKTYSNISIKEKEVVTGELDPLLNDEDFRTNINGDNIRTIINKTNDVYRYVDSTYLGKDNAYHSVCNFRYKLNEFSIDGIEENQYNVSKGDSPSLYFLLKKLIVS